MTILEKFIKGKRPDPSLCEDIIITTNDFIAVIDGMSDMVGFKINNMSTGKLSAVTIGNVIETMPYDIDAKNMVKLISSALHNIYINENILDKVALDPNCRLGSSLVIYSRHHKEVWSVGDIPFMVNSKLYDMSKRVDTLIYEVRSFYLQTLLLQGTSIDDLRENDPSKEFIKPLIQMGRYHQNCKDDTDYKHAILDGFPIDESLIKIVKIDENSMLVLASDGYPYLHASLEESEKALHDLINKDPLCFNPYHSAKGVEKGNFSFDDRAYIRFLAD